MAMTPICSAAQTRNARFMTLLLKKPILKSEWSLRMLKACTSWERLKVAKAMVRPTRRLEKMLLPMVKASRAIAPIISPSTKMQKPRPSANSPFFLSMGFWLIIMLSGASIPRALAGRESVTRFTQSS